MDLLPTPQEREHKFMKMELIQPFINAADAVLSQGLQGTTKVGNLTMEEDAYRRKGVAGVIARTRGIGGRVRLRLEAPTPGKGGHDYSGTDPPPAHGRVKEKDFV